VAVTLVRVSSLYAAPATFWTVGKSFENITQFPKKVHW
jgi:hypothetical protein